MADSLDFTQNPTILVVDDTPDNLSLMSGLLKDLYRVKVANSGDKALKIAQSDNPPDLILLDIMMPGSIDGLQVLDILKKTPELQHIPVAMLTARGQSSDFEFGMNKGADAYFVKPFSPLLLLQWIASRLA